VSKFSVILFRLLVLSVDNLCSNSTLITYVANYLSNLCSDMLTICLVYFYYEKMFDSVVIGGVYDTVGACNSQHRTRSQDKWNNVESN